MRHLRLELEYEGTAYHGWQVQPDAATVQQVVEEAIRRLTGEPCRLIGAGRTDAGVHALGQVAHFPTNNALDVSSMQRALNSLLPADVVVRKVTEAPPDFHARKSAVRKHYTYWIWNDPRRSAFHGRFCWHVKRPLDVERMRRAAQRLAGEHDFSSFRASGHDPSQHAVRLLERISVREVPPGYLRVRVAANGFLRHMVRILVGTLVEVGLGRFPEAFVDEILRARDRRRAGRTAPARGLFLVKVSYPPHMEERTEAGCGAPDGDGRDGAPPAGRFLSLTF